MKFDELDDDTRDMIIDGLMCYSTEVDDFSRLPERRIQRDT